MLKTCLCYKNRKIQFKMVLTMGGMALALLLGRTTESFGMKRGGVLQNDNSNKEFVEFAKYWSLLNEKALSYGNKWVDEFKNGLLHLANSGKATYENEKMLKMHTKIKKALLTQENACNKMLDDLKFKNITTDDKKIIENFKISNMMDPQRANLLMMEKPLQNGVFEELVPWALVSIKTGTAEVQIKVLNYLYKNLEASFKNACELNLIDELQKTHVDGQNIKNLRDKLGYHIQSLEHLSKLWDDFILTYNNADLAAVKQAKKELIDNKKLWHKKINSLMNDENIKKMYKEELLQKKQAEKEIQMQNQEEQDRVRKNKEREEAKNIREFTTKIEKKIKKYQMEKKLFDGVEENVKQDDFDPNLIAQFAEEESKMEEFLKDWDTLETIYHELRVKADVTQKNILENLRKNPNLEPAERGRQKVYNLFLDLAKHLYRQQKICEENDVFISQCIHKNTFMDQGKERMQNIKAEVTKRIKGIMDWEAEFDRNCRGKGIFHDVEFDRDFAWKSALKERLESEAWEAYVKKDNKQKHKKTLREELLQKKQAEKEIQMQNQEEQDRVRKNKEREEAKKQEDLEKVLQESYVPVVNYVEVQKKLQQEEAQGGEEEIATGKAVSKGESTEETS